MVKWQHLYAFFRALLREVCSGPKSEDLDGHKSHESIGLSEWALELGIVIFILTPHCSHILQPMDVGCFSCFQRISDSKCHKLIRELSSMITRYNVCEVAHSGGSRI